MDNTEWTELKNSVARITIDAMEDNGEGNKSLSSRRFAEAIFSNSGCSISHSPVMMWANGSSLPRVNRIAELLTHGTGWVRDYAVAVTNEYLKYEKSGNRFLKGVLDKQKAADVL